MSPQLNFSSRGFSLLEPVVVMAILGILATIGIPPDRFDERRAEVVGVFEVTESMRSKLMVVDVAGKLKGSDVYVSPGAALMAPLIVLGWIPGKPGRGLRGALTAAFRLPRISVAGLEGFVFEWRAQVN